MNEATKCMIVYVVRLAIPDYTMLKVSKSNSHDVSGRQNVKLLH